MKLKKFLKESALPPGFEGFGDDETKSSKNTASLNKIDALPAEVVRGTIVKVKSSKWEVFRRLSDYTAWAYKHPSKKRKAYEIVSIRKGVFEVWQTGGSGQRLKSKPEIVGKMTVI